MKAKYYCLFIFYLLSSNLWAQKWTGMVDSDWRNPDNWDTGTVPGLGSVVIISGRMPSYPALVENVEVKSLTISDGGRLDLAGHHLKINGYFFVNSAILINSGEAMGTVEVTEEGCRLNNSSFMGDFQFRITGRADFNEGMVSGPNTFEGNITYLFESDKPCSVSLNWLSAYRKNLTVRRTIAGLTNLFTARSDSSVAVWGDFTYENLEGGSLMLGGGSATIEFRKGIFVNHINRTDHLPVSITRINNRNSEGKGNISITNPGSVTISNDSLHLDNFRIKGIRSNVFRISHSVISVNEEFYIEDAPYRNESDKGNTGEWYLHENWINGTINIVIAGAGSYNDYVINEDKGSFFQGDITYTLAGPAEVQIGNGVGLQYSGKLKVVRLYPGYTFLMASGATLDGDFSYINKAGGSTVFGSYSENAKFSISGRIELDIANNDHVHVKRVANRKGGGKITVVDSRSVYFEQDTLIADSFTVIGALSVGEASGLRNSQVTTSGGFHFEDSPENNSPFHFGGITIKGPAFYVSHGKSVFYDSSPLGGDNYYLDDVSYKVTGSGQIIVGSHFPVHYKANVVVKSAYGIMLNGDHIFIEGSGTSSFLNEETEEIRLPGFVLNKENGNLVLLQPLINTGKIRFVKGHIEASPESPLIFGSVAQHTGASDLSHVIGPVQKVGNTSFTYPTGNGIRLMPATINGYSARTETLLSGIFAKAASLLKIPNAPLTRFQVSYFDRSMDQDGMNPADITPPVDVVYSEGYWFIEKLEGGSNVNISLGYNFPEGYVSDPASLMLARWNGTNWLGMNSRLSEGDTQRGWVTTELPVGDFGYFTIGSKGKINRLSARRNVEKSLSGPGDREFDLSPHVFPNPASSQLTFAFPSDKIDTVRLIHSSGREYSLSPRETTGAQNTFDIATLPEGVYLIQIATREGAVLMQRFLVNR